jgi:hypothetical protein
MLVGAMGVIVIIVMVIAIISVTGLVTPAVVLNGRTAYGFGLIEWAHLAHLCKKMAPFDAL